MDNIEILLPAEVVSVQCIVSANVYHIEEHECRQYSPIGNDIVILYNPNEFDGRANCTENSRAIGNS